MRLTVGPLPPAVYWRRRVIVLGAVLVLLFLVAQACMSAAASPEQDRTAGEPSAPPSSPAAAPPSGTPPATGSPATPDPTGSIAPATATATPAGTGSSAPVGPDACTDQELQITAEAERESFAAGTSVQFTIRIRNAGDRSCRRDIGGDQRELYLRQGTGATKVWSTRDCDPPTGSDVQELAPGFATSHFIVWHGRSSESCVGAQPDGPRVEPGEYQLTARLGTAHSDPVPITVTG